MSKNEARIIITTCNEYSELLSTQLYSFKKHWPDREWPITIATDEIIEKSKLHSDLDIFEYIDPYWSNIILKCLKTYDEEIILLLLDDFILRSKVNNQLLYGLVLNMHRNKKINYLRLVPRPKAKSNKMAVFNEINIDESYRVSLQASLWRKKFLIDFLEDNETPWLFEINGNKRSIKKNGFYASNIDLFPYKHHVIQRGKWFPWSFYKLKLNGYPITIRKRKIMNIVESMIWIIHKFAFKIKNLFIK